MKYCFPNIESFHHPSTRTEEITYFQNSDFDGLNYDLINDSNLMNYLQNIAIMKCVVTYLEVRTVSTDNLLSLSFIPQEMKFFMTSIHQKKMYIINFPSVEEEKRLKIRVLYMPQPST